MTMPPLNTVLAYRLFRRSNPEELISVYAGSGFSGNGLLVTYRKGEWSRAPSPEKGLTCFLELNEALAFREESDHPFRQRTDIELWACVVVDPRRPTFPLQNDKPWPAGTQMAQALMPVHRIL